MEHTKYLDALNKELANAQEEAKNTLSLLSRIIDQARDENLELYGPVAKEKHSGAQDFTSNKTNFAQQKREHVMSKTEQINAGAQDEVKEPMNELYLGPTVGKSLWAKEGAGLATGEENNLKSGETGSNDSPNKMDDGSFNFFSVVLGPGILFLYLVFLLFSVNPFQLYSIASYLYPY